MFRFLLKFLPLILHEAVDTLKDYLESRKEAKKIIQKIQKDE